MARGRLDFNVSRKWKFLQDIFGKENALNLYPPYLGAGVRAKPSDSGRGVVVQMTLGFLNENYVGTHFGGSLYSMTDPFFMFLLLFKLNGRTLVPNNIVVAQIFKQ